MPDNNTEQEVVSEKIIEIITAESTSAAVSDICVKNGVEDEKNIEDAAFQIGLSLLGELPPDELLEALKEKLNLQPEVARKIYNEVNDRIFSLVKNDLAELYRPPQAGAPSKSEPPKSSSKDTYREPVQ